jgi:hypothetical protein
VPPASKSTSRTRKAFSLVLFLVLVAGGGLALGPLWAVLHPSGRTVGPSRTGAAPSAAAARTPSASTRRPATSGLLFDAFHYTGPSDPALQAHGWQVRTSAGGPGISSTWSSSGVSFPSVASAQGGQALQLQVRTDGTRPGTTQSELRSTQSSFQNGTYAARVYFTDGPAVGENGDHINESFYTISPSTTITPYSELDYEYLPNGGWGDPRSVLDTVSWHSTAQGDRVYHPQYTRLHGWHLLTITAQDGRTTYALDGNTIFSNDAAHSPRGPMDVEFSTWLIDLPFTGDRTWNMQVNWFYYQAGKAQTLQQVQTAVSHYYTSGTYYLNTLGH